MKRCCVLGLMLCYLGLFPAVVYAKSGEDWFCKEAASQRTGNQIRSCGIGLGADENAARVSAFENAKKEFGSICSISSDCRGRAITVQPERTSCEKEESEKGYKCYRLLVFAIGDLVETDTASANLSTSEQSPTIDSKTAAAASASAPSRPSYEPLDLDQHETLKPFYYREIASLPKMRIGMTKASALAKFGKPSSVREFQGSVAVFYRSKPFCEGPSCSFRFDPHTGKIVSFSDFRFEYTETLK